MDNESGFISAGKEQLHYLKWGYGKRLLLAFHGYANDANLFCAFSKYLSEDYTILSFDLPHHGQSKWAQDLPLSKRDLAELVAQLKMEYEVDKVSLLGYSMGGRVCLMITELLPQSVDKMVLIATDGLSIDLYYYFFTRTFIGRKVFKNMLERPERFFRLIDWMAKRKWIDATRHKFAMQFLQSEHSRNFLQQVWPGMSELIPRPAKLKTTIKQYRIPITIFMGAYDRILPPKLAEKFKTGLDTVQLFVLQKGHRVFDGENTREMAQHLL